MKLSDQRYEQIKSEVVLLFKKAGMKTIPVNPWQLAKELGVELVKFSELSEEQREAALQLCDGAMKYRKIDADGMSHQVIIYNDSHMPRDTSIGNRRPPPVPSDRGRPAPLRSPTQSECLR